MGFWEEEAGEKSGGNWFKEHPKTTLLILFGAIVIIVIISI